MVDDDLHELAAAGDKKARARSCASQELTATDSSRLEPPDEPMRRVMNA